MFIRNLDKDDLSTILDLLGRYDGCTFAKARSVLGFNATVTRNVLEDLVFIGLLDHDGELYSVNPANVKLWEKYNREIDYKVFVRSDSAKMYFKEKGVQSDVPTYDGYDSWDKEE